MHGNINMIPVHEFNFSFLAYFHILVEPQKYRMNTLCIYF